MNTRTPHSPQTQAGNGIVPLVAIILAIAFAVWLWWSANSGKDTDADPVSAPVEEGAPVDAAAPAEDPAPEPEPAEPEAPAELTDATGAVFRYMPVGELLPDSGPGFGDDTVYRADITFPTEDRVFLNSQVYRHGGYHGPANGMSGGQCDTTNYDYPWQDTFCERRDRQQQLCPGGGHEGLDIRPATCARDVHWAVAAEDARVIDIRRHWVTLQTADGTLYNYLHLNMADLAVTLGQNVTKGSRIGRISNDFYKSDGTSVPTTTHLHFEMYENYVVADGDDPLFTKVNPYMTLVAAYDRRLRGE